MDCNGFEALAELPLVARRNNTLSSGGRFVVPGSLAAVVLAISFGLAFNGALRSHGNEVEFGIHLTDEQRAAVARRPKEHLKIR